MKTGNTLLEISSGLVLLPHELGKVFQSFLFSELQMGDCGPVFLYFYSQTFQLVLGVIVFLLQLGHNVLL